MCSDHGAKIFPRFDGVMVGNSERYNPVDGYQLAFNGAFCENQCCLDFMVRWHYRKTSDKFSSDGEVF